MANQSFPVGCEVLNFGRYAEVVDYHEDGLIVKGIGPDAQVGKWLAASDKCQRVSAGSIGFANGYEYFVRGADLYRANASNYIGVDGFRAGGRWQMPTRLVDSEYLRSVGL